MSSSQIFQKKALEKLKQPEKAGTVFVITTSTGWIALAAVAIMLFSIVVWSVFGVMADKVTGYGILLDDNGVANIAPTSGGRVIEMNKEAGERVAKGDVVAVIEQSELEQQVYLNAEQAHTATSYEDMRSRTAQLASAKEKFHQQAQVISPYDGKVVARRVRTGEIVQAGAVLYDVDVQEKNQDIFAVIFVPALTGNKIKPGTTLQVSPGAIDASLYGSLVGTVIDISTFPVNSDRVTYWTGNREFANWVVKQNGGAVMEVRVELTRDDSTKSGYLWTTMEGPDENLSEGMTCTAIAIVDRKAPLVYAFDKLKQWIRSD
ncbi:MAG: efflux RND transporter periplasmic adaptor subunit [Schwartzia sp.]|nr:efflux RND transporter periplasmic adaptor subunit [Schwartzia sp. (in: firmicutes)]